MGHAMSPSTQTQEGAPGSGASTSCLTATPSPPRGSGEVAGPECHLGPGSDTQPKDPEQVCSLGRASGYLHRMQPRLGTSDSFHSCHGNMVQGANGGQAGIGRKVTGTQIKVIPSTTQVIRAGLGAGSGRSVMPVSLRFTL